MNIGIKKKTIYPRPSFLVEYRSTLQHRGFSGGSRPIAKPRNTYRAVAVKGVLFGQDRMNELILPRFDKGTDARQFLNYLRRSIQRKVTWRIPSSGAHISKIGRIRLIQKKSIVRYSRVLKIARIFHCG